jgi:hypothetical protein
MTVIGMRAGDAFLAFLGEKLHVKLTHEQHVGFLSCFMLKFIALDDPVLTLTDFDLELGAKKAHIAPDFGKLISEKAIILNCTLEDVTFLGGGAEDDFTDLFGRMRDNAYDTIYTELVIYNDRVRFPFFTAHGKDVKLYASGTMAKKGDLDLNLRAFFSPRVAGQIPEELRDMLVEKPGGWMSYRLHMESGKDKPFLKLESDKLKLSFEEVDIK